MQRLLFLAFIAGCSAISDKDVKEEVAAGYFSSPQSDSGYGYDQPTYQQPSYQQPFYQPQLMMPPFALLTYDVAYCSVHASFPLVGARKHHKDHGRHHHHNHYGHRVRKFERQSCRYTAVFSWEACNTCCKVASRTNGNTNMNDVVGALFVFDPDMDFLRHDDHPDNSNNKAVQCVCCAPKKF